MASKSLNKVTLIGNVTRDPELRYTPQGNAVATFGLATNRQWKTESGEVREDAEFHRLVAWNKLAELCSQLITKGRKIYVEGRLQTRSFTGSDNAQHTITEIVIDDMILLDSRYVAGTTGTKQVSQVSQAPQAAPEEVEPVVQPQAPADDSAKKKPAKKKADSEGTKENSEDVDISDIPF